MQTARPMDSEGPTLVWRRIAFAAAGLLVAAGAAFVALGDLLH